MGHFFPAYNFDLDRTIYIFTSGRYEYGNKGMDLFIESLAQVNQRLRGVADRPTIVAFIITKAPVRNINRRRSPEPHDVRRIGKRVQSGRATDGQAAFPRRRSGPASDHERSARRRFDGPPPKQTIHAWRHGRQPAIVTHDLWDDANDPVLRHLRHRWLFNSADDPVKVIFHPQFISPTGPLINLDYDQFVPRLSHGRCSPAITSRGLHADGIRCFGRPGRHQPISAASAPTCSGTFTTTESHGIHVLDRRGRPIGEFINDLAPTTSSSSHRSAGASASNCATKSSDSANDSTGRSS